MNRLYFCDKTEFEEILFVKIICDVGDRKGVRMRTKKIFHSSFSVLTNI